MHQNLRPVLLPRDPPLRLKLPDEDEPEELRELPDDDELLVLLPEDRLPPNRPPREPSPLSEPELRGEVPGVLPAEGLWGVGGVTLRPDGRCGAGGVALRVFPPQ